MPATKGGEDKHIVTTATKAKEYKSKKVLPPNIIILVRDCCVVLCLFCDMKLTVGRIPPYSCYSFGCLVTFISSSSPSEF